MRDWCKLLGMKRHYIVMCRDRRRTDQGEDIQSEDVREGKDSDRDLEVLETGVVQRNGVFFLKNWQKRTQYQTLPAWYEVATKDSVVSIVQRK
eukprot:g21270.t1